MFHNIFLSNFLFTRIFVTLKLFSLHFFLLDTFKLMINRKLNSSYNRFSNAIDLKFSGTTHHCPMLMSVVPSDVKKYLGTWLVTQYLYITFFHIFIYILFFYDFLFHSLLLVKSFAIYIK